MPPTEAEFAFALRRAQEEAIRAISATSGTAAAAHHELSVLYSARALLAIEQGMPARRRAGSEAAAAEAPGD